MKLQKPKGTRDFFPEDMESRNQVFDRLRNIAKRYGFGEVESPAFENIETLTAKQGGEILEQIFVLEKKGDEQFGLRYDLTVPITRMFVEKQKDTPKPVKWFYMTKMWRYERPQSGRLREFYQFGVELFGSDKAEADAEVISLAIDALLDLGLKESDFIVKINNRKLLQGLIYGFNIVNKVDEVIRVIDKAKKIAESEFQKELEGLGLNFGQIKNIEEMMKIRNPEEFEKFDLNDEAKLGLEELKKVINFLKTYGKESFIQIDLSVARGLLYYTGTVFECFDREEKMRSIFAGGRYDKLVEQFGGQPCPATGFAMGDVTSQILLEKRGLWPRAYIGPDYYIAIVSSDVRKKAIEIAQKLRGQYSVDIDLMERALGKQMQYAASIAAKKVVIIGPDELNKGKVKVRDMASGKEEDVKIDELI